MSEGQGFARRVTLATLHSFAPLLRKRKGALEAEGTETGGEGELNSDAANIGVTSDPEFAAAEALFRGEHFETGVSLTRPKREQSSGTVTARPNPTVRKPAEDTKAELHLLWREVLSDTDAQRQSGNHTGDLRLTQARFRGEDGEFINHRIYFREAVFRELDWGTVGEVPYKEGAWANFRVVILGEDQGTQRLMVQYKPSGEAGQGNYPTGLQWGDTLTELLRTGVNVSGKILTLYGPGDGKGPYLIEITEPAGAD